MRKMLIFCILFYIAGVAFAQEETQDENTEEGQKKKQSTDKFFYIGIGPEINANTREGIAAGVGLAFGFDLNQAVAMGIKAAYGNDFGIKAANSGNFGTVSSIEPALFFRYCLPVKGLFLQAEAGGIFFFEHGEAYPAFLGGGAVGWRYVFKNNWYIEPYVRGGYPYKWGVGLTVGYRIPQRSKETREAVNRRKALAEEITAILEEQNIKDASVEVSDEGVTIRLSNIQFIADSTRMPQTEVAKIVEIAGILKSLPERKILVAGHTADTGTGNRIGDLRLSHDRAMVVMSLLIRHGDINERNISVVGYGPDRPIADNSAEAGRAVNRRVEIVILEN